MPDHAATYPPDAHSDPSFPKKIPMSEGLMQMFQGFIPYLIDFAGVQDDPWNIGDEPIFSQWVGYLKSVLKGDLGEVAHRPVIILNSQYQLTLWRDSIATRALLHLTDALDALPTPEDRKQWVLDRLYLHDTSPRCLPLYFRKIKNSKGLRVRVDIYQAPIVASAFSLHLHIIGDIPQHLRMPRMAVGALILSLQASLRAAELWRSGQRAAPPHRLFEDNNGEASYHLSQIKTYEGKGKSWDDVICIARRYMIEEDPRDYRLLSPYDAEEESTSG
ncbi:hypothetical protein FA13DRAFT_1735839 [Coprinellus micaceus]|uniref:Uncharacterized protein n=1 Tax=Coprinellus micaceus TaxID=71717 RepID=A0A4Y7T257_COPMI|nr:hypothetical protein FA13DRAFT_1735839 [Coprinellus micaceus]